MPKSAAPPKPRRNVALAKAIAVDGRPLYVIAGASGSCNPRLLSAVIRGTVQPTAAVKAGIARALKVPESDLFGDG